MRKLVTILGVILVTLFAGQAAHAQDSTVTGERLLRNFWSTLKSDDPAAEAKLYGTGFQSVHQDGARDAEQTLKFIRNIELDDYQLSKIKITEEGPVIVTTYFVTTAETLGGKRLSSRKSARMTVFLKTDQGWKIIAHANLTPLNP
jgi:hypothetical protein